MIEAADELHDLGFNAGWNGAIEECAKIAEHFRDSHATKCIADPITICKSISTRIRALASGEKSK